MEKKMFEMRCSFLIDAKMLLSENIVVKYSNQQAEHQKLFNFFEKCKVNSITGISAESDSLTIVSDVHGIIRLQINTSLLDITSHYISCLFNGASKELFLLDIENSLSGEVSRRIFFTLDDELSNGSLVELKYASDFNIISYLTKLEVPAVCENHAIYSEARLNVKYDTFLNKTASGQIYKSYFELKKAKLNSKKQIR